LTTQRFQIWRGPRRKRAGTRTITRLGTLAISTVVVVLVVGAAEIALRGVYAARNALVDVVALPYAPGERYGPVPPWANGLRLLEPDTHLMWRNRPGVRRRYVDVFGPAPDERARTAILGRFLPTLPRHLRGSPTWELTINTRGFRTPEFTADRLASGLRIVCLGDSWTFGANVDDEDTYPRRLAALLRSRFPAVAVEVMNLGVMGYTSHQGLTLLRREALALQPDVVIIGFAMNDSAVAGYRDRDVTGAPPPTTVQRAIALAAGLEVVHIPRYAVLRLIHEPASLVSLLRAEEAGARGPRRRPETAEEYATLEAWTRVPLDDYRRNIREMIALAREQGAAVVLLFNEVWLHNPYGAALADVARTEDVALVNSAALIAREQRRLADDAERAQGLLPSAVPHRGTTPDAVEAVFRVRDGGQPVPRALMVVGPHPALGDLVPNRIGLRDDGGGGDERAGDGVWSYLARFSAGIKIPYVYTNSGSEGRWDGLDVPAVRGLSLIDARAGERRYLPLETFGRLVLQADAWHTDARGYRLIAHALLEAFMADDGIRRRLGADSTR
jgi:lysophospholipase L1-like esterase